VYQSEFAAFQGLIGDLCEAFNRPLKDDLVRVFWDALKEFPLQQLKSRVRIHIATSKKFPSPADLRPAPFQPASGPTGPHPVTVLEDHMRAMGLTDGQLHGVSYIGNPNQITGVEIPLPHGEGRFRVMLRDIGHGAA
jgi:hypothetical protein